MITDDVSNPQQDLTTAATGLTLRAVPLYLAPAVAHGTNNAIVLVPVAVLTQP